MSNRIPAFSNPESSGPESSAHGIIDAHVHIWTPDQKLFPHDPHYSGPEYQPTSFTADQALAIARPCGVEHIVLVQMSFYGTDNSYLLHAIAHHPGVFSGIAVVDWTSSSLAAEMERLRPLGVRGFRIDRGSRDADWLETRHMHEFWRLAAEHQMAICPLINPGSIATVDRMCTAHPDTTVVVDHIARIGIDGHIRPEEVRALCRLAHRPHAHVKISAFYALGKKQYPYTDLIPMIHALYDAYGSSRLMWGSDSPFQVEAPHSYAGSLELVRNHLDFLTRQDEEWLLRKTARKIFFT